MTVVDVECRMVVGNFLLVLRHSADNIVSGHFKILRKESTALPSAMGLGRQSLLFSFYFGILFSSSFVLFFVVSFGYYLFQKDPIFRLNDSPRQSMFSVIVMFSFILFNDL